MLHESRQKGEWVTGLIYYKKDAVDFNNLLHLTETPLAQLGETELRPSKSVLDEIMQELM